MHGLQPNHPCPTFSLPAGIDPDSTDSVRRFVSRHSFPSAKDGRFLFAYVDEEQRFEVWLRHKLAGHRQPQKMIRCAGGIHLLQMHAPAVHRVEYNFKLIDGEGATSFALDPLNSASVRDPFSSESVLTTSEYRSPTYINDPPDNARGTLDELAIECPPPPGKPWPTWIWSPPSTTRATALPVTIFLDGSDWLQLAGARDILENLVHTRAIRPCRAVFMKPASRNEEYATNPHTAIFLHDELSRALGAHFPWPAEPRERIAVGVSLGALCLTHAHFTQGGPFGGLILQSGSFFQPHSDAMERDYPHFQRICEFVSHISNRSLHDVARIPIHMTCGAGEENIINNRAMARSLREQGFPLTFHEQPDAHNWTCWRDSIGEGLTRMLG
jgi:enterochelin esterase-like enzyme